VADVFISYGSADRPIARRLAEELAGRGHTVWWDRALTPGAEFAREIERELEAARVVVVLWSPRSVDSPWVRDEASVARDRRTLLPAVVEGSLPPLGFRQLHAVTVGPDAAEDRLAALVSAIEDRLAGRTPAAAVPHRAPASAPTAARRRGILAAAALCALLGGVAVMLVPGLRAHLPGSETPSSPAAHPSVAVLAFDNLSGDHANDFVGLGLAEMVLNRLATSPALTVISRSSSFALQGARLTAPEIGTRLGAHYLVQGGVQRAGERLRVSVQLVDAPTGKQLRAIALDRSMTDLFAVQDELATQVAVALNAAQLAASSPTTSVDAQLEYLRGLEALGRERVADVEAAIPHFLEAQRLDPRYAPAYVGEARARLRASSLRDPNDESLDPQLRRLIDHALALDPSLGAAYVLRGVLAGAEASGIPDLRRGVELAPNDAEGYFALARLLAAQPNHGNEPKALYDRAVALDPLQPRYRFLRALYVADLAHDSREVIAALEDVLKVDPDYPPALERLALEQTQLQGYAEATRYAERALAVDPESFMARQRLFQLYATMGDAAAARDVLSGLPPTSGFWAALALLEGDVRRAGELAGTAFTTADGRQAYPAAGGVGEVAVTVAIVADAIRTRNYAHAAEVLRRAHCRGRDPTGCAETEPALVGLGQLEIAAGRHAAGEALIRAAGVFDHPMAPGNALGLALRAIASAEFGRPDAALADLETATRDGGMFGWWFWLVHEPAFDALRSQPRFRAVLAKSQAMAAREHAALDRLRRAGKIPWRPASAAVG
jgi:TolB-like protein/cytochrome c-type biogenesis protein CcmH/NrfG